MCVFTPVNLRFIVYKNATGSINNFFFSLYLQMRVTEKIKRNHLIITEQTNFFWIDRMYPKKERLVVMSKTKTKPWLLLVLVLGL